MPVLQVGRCNFSFGPWILSSNNEKPVNPINPQRLLEHQYRADASTAPLEDGWFPKSRLKRIPSPELLEICDW